MVLYSSKADWTVRPNPEGRIVRKLEGQIETWRFPVGKLGSTRLSVMVYKGVLTKGYPKGAVKLTHCDILGGFYSK